MVKLNCNRVETDLPKNRKQQQEASNKKPINYTLDSQKITFDFLKAHLWGAADILRGSLDPADYRQPVMTLLFLKRLNDTFEENAEKLIKEGKSQKEAYDNKNRHYFFVPKEARSGTKLTRRLYQIGYTEVIVVNH
jgi:type I restriction-modification system DNA methylase subunit